MGDDDHGDSSVQTTNLAMASVDQTRAECSVLVSMMEAISEKVRAETELRKPLIQKVPEPLRSIENGAAYFNPEIVAIGPYHRDDPQLQPMEEIKKAAARDLCNSSTSHSVEEFYAKVREVAGEARSCYADRFDDMISEKEFTDMMFFDGCFLLEVIALGVDDCPPYSFLSRWMTLPCWSLIYRDLMLFENQIPWVVLEALMSLRPVPINRFLRDFPLTADVDFSRLLTEGEEGSRGRKPCHMLDLMRDRYLGPKMEQKDIKAAAGMSLFSSATDLAEVGVRIRASKTFHFRDISFHRDLLFGRLSLPPIVIGGPTQVHIANMVALERCTVDESGYDYGVGSYLSLLALLMSGEEDVKELRLKRIMHSVLSDRQTIDFFKSLSLHLLPRDNYRYVLQRLNDYYRKRRVRVVLHRFIYKNFKFILAATSAVIFFVTILQTIFTVYPRQ